LEVEELEASVVRSPDFRYAHRGEDLEPIQRGARDIDFNDQVRYRVGLQIELALAPDAPGIVPEPVTLIGLRSLV
jgi:hypothetical protein